MTEQDTDLSSVELIDLAEDRTPASYAQVGPRDYRKLHALHTSIQGDKSINLPKRNPLPSSANAAQTYFQEDQIADDSFKDDGIDDDDFPSPSQLFARSEPLETPRAVETVKACEWSDAPETTEPVEEFEDVFESHSVPYKQDVPVSPNYGDELEGFETDLQDLGYSAILQQTTPNIIKSHSSFDNTKANDLFDFDAFEIMSDSPSNPTTTSAFETMVSENSSISKNSRKRARSPFPNTDTEPFKRLQLSTDEDEDEKEETAPVLTTPSWVSEFDADLIDDLRGFVEFVD